MAAQRRLAQTRPPRGAAKGISRPTEPWAWRGTGVRAPRSHDERFASPTVSQPRVAAPVTATDVNPFERGALTGEEIGERLRRYTLQHPEDCQRSKPRKRRRCVVRASEFLDSSIL